MPSSTPATLNPTVAEVTQRIRERSAERRALYEQRMADQHKRGVHRAELSCGNLAHGFAACSPQEKDSLKLMNSANLGIISSYNDMLSAHQPFETFPETIKAAASAMGSTAQFAGGVPAMCDGVTQGQPGMELSLFSRDVIAMAAAVGLSHNMFDAALYLGVCDKIIPGLFIAAARFGHLPAMFVPAGPMPSGLPNKEKARIRQLYAEGKVGREELLQAESDSYHSPGTCTFYGTANSNQLMMEVMGLHLPGTSFVNPGTEMREALTRYATEQAIRNTEPGGDYRPFYKQIDERAIVNAVVGLLASGGSTNHTMHLIAMAAASGITLNWDDFTDLSAVTPSLMQVYPNGQADINHFQAAGGMSYLFRELLGAGLLHGDIPTVFGTDLTAYTQEPFLENGKVVWREGPESSLDENVLRPVATPFAATGGLTVMKGNLGRGVIKVSAVADEHRVVEAPVKIFADQNEMKAAFESGDLDRDVIVVVRFQGPKANGMPELHKLTPFLGVLQDRGFKVALVTDGRMSGASGKVPAAIHISPEALDGGPLSKLRDGDIVRLDANAGTLEAKVEAATWADRERVVANLDHYHVGLGRELFSGFRHLAMRGEEGAGSLGGFEADDLARQQGQILQEDA
ncbi:MAG: phosphogluconate dehydratase [Vreelandella alkaliphila]|uniref:Phosphogluconate dehydratase n=2 Tax=Halomonas TaxID=2745 RepID=A0A3D0KGY5_9GAMM|nr:MULTISPECIES: phosphogluconate dehydratase [Halomonas]HBP40411.1 phosphogluconate dehydratase [Halomonas sp.]HBS84014.1 phosphogluconate dehydratase [Halomonas campaniensis]ASK18570.1 phosphogluconate dehydratase [Halomonas sp. N3-2A]MCD6006084.1 phosphogluconate dehydratase [Halomonas sp. IOP_6]UTD54383.1 phosphogluconate dehydratase [Halomonas sp. MS1]